MWEWGNFPQRTPIRTGFEAGGLHESRKGKERMPELGVDTNVGASGSGGTIMSSPISYTPDVESEGGDAMRYGEGGRLGVDRRDSTRFKVSIERRVVDFELSTVHGVGQADADWSGKGSLGGEDEVEDAQRFDQGKIDFQQFLDDERIVKDEDLVLKWAGGM